ncbi:MAG: D-ribose pyranase [Treponema sp.]|jgi:D-ribose pyranase|nr:D-ribose pyranase [Treponema sp.]
MKKSILLNPEISYEIAKIGHTQTITIGDAGLPIPKNVKRVDLAVAKQIPAFLQVLDAVLTEMKVEKIILAKEINAKAPELKDEILKRFPQNEVTVEFVEHEKFKKITEETNVIIRTGETTPYANVILTSGVTF